MMMAAVRGGGRHMRSARFLILAPIITVDIIISLFIARNNKSKIIIVITTPAVQLDKQSAETGPRIRLTESAPFVTS